MHPNLTHILDQITNSSPIFSGASAVVVAPTATSEICIKFEAVVGDAIDSSQSSELTAVFNHPNLVHLKENGIIPREKVPEPVRSKIAAALKPCQFLLALVYEYCNSGTALSLCSDAGVDSVYFTCLYFFSQFLSVLHLFRKNCFG